MTRQSASNVAAARARVVASLESMKLAAFERDDVFTSIVIAAIAGEHVFLLGTPGTAKSLAARIFVEAVTGARYFETLMTRFTTPDEIFGPMSLKALEQDRVCRVLDGRFADVDVAFLDEIFKANSAILNALLGALNERVVHNDGKVCRIPLRLCVAASNEVPDDDSALEAMFDRFALRHIVKSVDVVANQKAMFFAKPKKHAIAPLLIADLDLLREVADDVGFDAAAADAMIAILNELRGAGIRISDRRWKKVAGVLRAAVALDGRDAVVVDDIGQGLVLAASWNSTEEIETARGIIETHAAPWISEVRRMTSVLQEQRTVLETSKAARGVERMQKLLVIGGVMDMLDGLAKEVGAMSSTAPKSATAMLTTLMSTADGIRSDAKAMLREVESNA